MATKKTSTGSAGEKEPSVSANEPYVVLARKYRPHTFEDLIGQDAMVATLRNAFASGRLAQGYMLTGVRGVGKTTTARILARALNFEAVSSEEDAATAKGGPTVDLPRDPADYGRHCTDIMASRHPDVIEMDAASNTGVDNVREIIESARYRPLVARYKVFIVDEVHMLSKGAFNALLKTLEEPPEHVKFIFATTEIRKVPVTVLSRCQRFDLRRVDVPLLKDHFSRILAEEGASAEADALTLIARAAGGSVRDGLSILDQAIAFSKSDVTAAGVREMIGLADRGRIFDLAEKLLGGTPAEALAELAGLHRDGAEPTQILGDLAEVIHMATRVKVAGADAGSEALSAEEIRRAGSLAGRLSIPLMSRVWQMLIKGFEDAARSPDPRAAVEMVLVRIAYTSDLPSPDEVIKALGGEPVAKPGQRRATEGAVDAAGHSAELIGEASQASASQTEARQPDVAVSRPSDPDVRTRNDAFDTARFDDVPPWEDTGPVADRDDADIDDGDPIAGDLGPSPALALADPRSFREVVALVGAKRDAKLKIHLEEHVSLVRFETPQPGEEGSCAIDLYLLKGAPPEIANELREKLNVWTGRRWIVMLSKSPGEETLGDVRRREEVEEIERLKADPLVSAAFQAFPDAKVTAVRTIDTGEPEAETDIVPTTKSTG